MTTMALTRYEDRPASILRGTKVLRFIGWLLSTPPTPPSCCSNCGRVGEHAPWCIHTVRESLGIVTRLCMVH